MYSFNTDHYALVVKEFELHGKTWKPGQVIRYKEVNDLILNLYKMKAITEQTHGFVPYTNFEVK